MCGQMGPLGNKPHCVGGAWAQPSAIMMRPEFRFVGRHVGIDRAIALAAFAAETKVERFFDGAALPQVFDWAAVQHFEQKTCPSAGRITLLARRLKAWAHDALAGVLTPAGADSDASHHRFGEAAVVWIVKMTLDLGRLILRPHPQI